MAVKITQKYELFKDVDGDPLENGYVYIGTTGLNPEVSPITVYFDEELTLPASQPLRTSGGYIQNAGTPTNIYTNSDYSITVRNKNETLIYTSLSNNAEVGLTSSVDTIGDLIGLDEATTTEELEVYGYHEKGDNSGGLFIWDSTASKADANGGTIVDPTVSLANQGTGVGTGCWIRQYSGAVNVKWFGAKGDELNDDTASIQKTLDSNPEEYITSDKYKTYRITDTLHITSGVLLDLNMATISLDDSSGIKDALKIGDGITQLGGVIIRSVILSRVQIATAGYAINTDFTGVCEISNCRIYGNNKFYNGIKILRGTINSILNNYIDNCINYGIYLEGTGLGGNKTIDIKIINNRIEGGVSALNAYDFVEGLFVRNNIFFNFTDAIVTIAPSSDANGLVSFKFQENDFDSGQNAGLYLEHISNIQVTDNWFSSIQNDCLAIKSTTDSVVISGNQMYPTNNGMVIEGTSCNISNNLVSGGSNQISAKSTSDNINISSNSLMNAAIGVVIDNATGKTLVSSNNFNNNTTDIFEGTATDVSIYNNKGDGAIGLSSFVTLTGSPMTYKTGMRPEYLSIFSGTVSSIKIGGNAVRFSTDVALTVPPNTDVEITYSADPFLLKVSL